MAVCEFCGYKHFDDYECSNCKTRIFYTCWNCGFELEAYREEKCSGCGWYYCPNCNMCGCHEDRPPSNMELGYGWTEYDN